MLDVLHEFISRYDGKRFHAERKMKLQFSCNNISNGISNFHLVKWDSDTETIVFEIEEREYTILNLQTQHSFPFRPDYCLTTSNNQITLSFIDALSSNTFMNDARSFQRFDASYKELLVSLI